MGADVQDGRPVKSGATTVCLIGAGGRVGHRMIHMPVGFVRMTTGPLTWGRFTAPQRHAATREIPCARARVSGGGSSINAEVFTRGHPSDDDRWEEEGATGWNHAAVHPCFLRSEGNSVLSGPASRGSVTLRSDDPAALPVVDPNVLAEPEGLRVFAEGVKISRDIFGQSSLQRYIRTIRFPDDSVRSQA